MSKNQVKKPSLGKKKETKKTVENLSDNLGELDNVLLKLQNKKSNNLEELDNVILKLQKNLNMDVEKVSEPVVPVVEAKSVEKPTKKKVVNKPSNKMMTKD
jgi:hypothetical protein